MKKLLLLLVALSGLILSQVAPAATTECYTDQKQYGTKVCRLAVGVNIWVVDNPVIIAKPGYQTTSNPGDQAIYVAGASGSYIMVGYKNITHSKVYCNWPINKWKLTYNQSSMNDPTVWANITYTANWATANGVSWGWWTGDSGYRTLSCGA